MPLLQAHKILISAAILMFAFLTLWTLRRGFLIGEVPTHVAAAVLSGAVTAGLVLYHRRRFRHPPS